MNPAYIALGSNLQNPQQQLHSAIRAIAQLAQSSIGPISSFYRSTAVGPGKQPDYLNAVLRLDTKLEPLALLDELQNIEDSQGRVRQEHWGPRTLDLDLLLYGDLVLASPRLTIPHPRMHQRDFVLYPLQEISDTNLVLPDGSKLDSLVEQCPTNNLAQIKKQPEAQ